MGLLVSPISWSHHWVWVLLIPPMLIGPRRSDTDPVVRALLWGVVVLAVLGPYWWFRTGASSDAFEALLPVWTFAALALWGRAEFAQWRRDDRPSEPMVQETAALH